MTHLARAVAVIGLVGVLATPVAQAAGKPKLGPNAVPITADHAYLRTAVAADYWAFSPYDKPQFTTSACSIASVTMALNGLRGLPKKASTKVPTQQAVLKKVGSKAWQNKSAEGGEGVTFPELRRYTRAAMDAYGIRTHRSPHSVRGGLTPAHWRRPWRSWPATRPAPTTSR